MLNIEQYSEIRQNKSSFASKAEELFMFIDYSSTKWHFRAKKISKWTNQLTTLT